MDEQAMEHFRARLLAMKADLEALDEGAKESTGTVVLDQTSVGRLSRMDAMQGQQMALETQRRRRQQIVQIEAALKRIDQDEFGYCVNCDEPIAPGRLEFNPTVTRCVGCSE